MDPESSKDGISWPNISMEMDGHLETTLFNTHCLVSEDTALLVNVLSMSSNLAIDGEFCVGSTLTHPLCP